VDGGLQCGAAIAEPRNKLPYLLDRNAVGVGEWAQFIASACSNLIAVLRSSPGLVVSHGNAPHV
jgi:hypothetical protein